MKQTYLLLFLLVCQSVKGQGLLGLGSQNLSKKKIQKIALIVRDTEHLSPSSTIPLGVIAYDKKLKEFKTQDLSGGEYSFNYNYLVEVVNGVYDEKKQHVKINPVNSLTGDEVKIKVTLKGGAAISSELSFKIDYKGLAVADYSGKYGRNGTPGRPNWGGMDGSPGQNGGNNSEAGENGGNITVYAKLTTVDGEEYVRVHIINNITQADDYYSVKKDGGKILIDVSGGAGGKGGNGAAGTQGNKDRYINGGKGGDGGNGANGGNGGTIVVKLDENMKGAESLIQYLYFGGSGGAAGAGGTGGDGYRRGANGKNGLQGISGLSSPKPQITYEKNMIVKWFD